MFFIKKYLKEIKKNKILKTNAKKYDTHLKSIYFSDNETLIFIEAEAPEVSIIIPVHNQLQYTLNCLLSIFNCEDHIEKEIIIVNDASTDDTLFYLNKIKGIKIINNSENKGFLKSVNRGILEAKGKYIYLLNNDTKVQKGYLQNLLEVFLQYPDAGAAGSKMIFANSHLQEAGCLLFENEIVVNRGATKSPDNPKFNFFREVDYCSGCSLMFKRNDDSGKTNFLDEEYSPAYYEETDLCMRLKNQQQLKIYYQPKSEIIHFENISYARQSESKKLLLEKNHKIFWKKWGTKISGREFVEKNGKNLLNDNKGYKGSILFLEEYFPKFDKDSGSNRFTEIVKIMVHNNYKVYFSAKNINHESDEFYIDYFERLGVEVIRDYVNTNGKIVKIKKQLREVAPIIDYIWISRPESYQFWIPILKKFDIESKIIYDTVDLHFLRFEREKEFFKTISNTSKKKQNYTIRYENLAFRNSNAVIAISNEEKNILSDLGISKDKIFVVSNIHQVKENIVFPDYESRKGLVFIGGFHHKPNVDAVQYLHNEIMPLVWKEIKDAEVYIIGGDLPDEISKLNSEKFKILGYQKMIDHYFLNSRIFVAPLRYGAGVKGKIGQALEYKLPVVSTTIGVEGMFLNPEINALVSEPDDPEIFAKQIIRLYNDKSLWHQLHKNSESSLSFFSIETQERKIMEMLKYLNS